MSQPAKRKEVIVCVPPKLLTEREVRIAGATSNRLCSLRDYRGKHISGGSLTISNNAGTSSLALGATDTQALIDLLIERDELFLTSLNIELEA